MLKHRWTNRICCIVLTLSLLLTVVITGIAATSEGAGRNMGYEHRLFDQSRVHEIEIIMEDWEAFLETCANEEYALCTVIIDGEVYRNVGIRAKGNTSLSSVQSYGNNRYSFKIEFDHYSPGSYHGLDKLSLNNVIQDTTYMKDFLAYTLMREMDAAAPLCSYASIKVNGEVWGLYLAVEAVEDAFLQRNYGSDYGELYKPDSMSFGGGRGNGRDFDMGDFAEMFGEGNEEMPIPGMPGNMEFPGGNMPEGGMSFPSGGMPGNMEFPGGNMPEGGMSFPDGGMPGNMEFPGGNMPEGDVRVPDDMRMGDAPSDGAEPQAEAEEAVNEASSKGAGRFSGGMGGFGGMGSSDVKLQYSDDDPASYANIFNNAKTDITEADQHRLIASLKTMGEGDTSVVDTDAVIRYLVVHNFLCNDDSYTGTMVHNYYLYEENGVLSMIPWDYNLAMGGFSMGGGSGANSLVNSPIDSPVSGDVADRPMVAGIFEDEEYLQQYHDLYGEFMDRIYASGWLAQKIDDTIALILPYVEDDPTAFYSYDEFLQGAQSLREFCLLRCESVSGQLDGSIPSTSEGQNADGASLIDASHITPSDMGGMGKGGFGGMGDRSGGNGREKSRGKADSGNDAAQARSAGDMPSFSPDAVGVNPSSGGIMPQTGSAGMIGLSALVLLLAFVAVVLAKGRCS